MPGNVRSGRRAGHDRDIRYTDNVVSLITHKAHNHYGEPMRVAEYAAPAAAGDLHPLARRAPQTGTLRVLPSALII